MAPPLPYEEVVIDGDTSTDDDDATDVVVVQTPQSRKRRRQSTILDDDDEALASSQSQTQNQSQAAPPRRGGPHAMPAANEQEEIDDDEDDEEDEVEIIQVSTPSSAEAKRRKAKRLTIIDSDEEHDVEEMHARATTLRASPNAQQRTVNKLELEPVGRLSATPSHVSGNRESASSTGRRSSTRIERKREEKEKAGPSARKLEFLSLDNCLDRPSLSRRTAGDDDEEEEFIVDDDEEDDAASDDDEILSRRQQKQKKRQRTRSPPPPRRATTTDDDLDEFIVDDDEVEYMDDDEEGVMDQPLSSADEIDEGDDDDLRATMQSREPSEWFAIYLRYLEECILDENLDNKIRTTRRNPEYRLFEQAVHHIERAICSRRDTLRSSVVWNDDIMDNLHCATKFHSSRCMATTDCQACRRANHFATQLVQFGGFACDSTELYKPNWMKKLRVAVSELEPMRASFELGTVCHARTLGYWQLLHAKHFWVVLVDAKRHESGDGHGRIAESEREAFYKAEYGRYKRLINIVDKFSTETSQSVSFMPNVWKKVNANHVLSEFLPSPGSRGSKDNGVRRGALDSLVGESDAKDEDDTEDEEEEEEEEENDEIEEKRAVPDQSSALSGNARSDREDEQTTSSPITTTAARKKMRQSTMFSAINSSSSNTKTHSADSVKPQSSAAESTKVSRQMKPLDEVEAEDLVCLVCRQNQRDGAVAHGNYLHFYSCYRCAKRQHAAKQGCMVCDRPIDNVLRILPLSKESRADILKQQEAT